MGEAAEGAPVSFQCALNDEWLLGDAQEWRVGAEVVRAGRRNGDAKLKLSTTG